MHRKYFLCLLLLCLGFVVTVQGKGHGKKKDAPYFKLVSAYCQRTIPGIPGAQVKTDYYIIVKWLGALPPDVIFWRGENTWYTCDARIVHRKGSQFKDADDYRIDNKLISGIHKGDTLLIRPIPGGKFPMPPEVDRATKNTLYFKTGGKGYFSFPVKDISAKPDIMLQ